jgi:LacI family transcriptional regulator
MKAVVVGASLSGLMTGLGLSRVGVEVTILERVDEFPRTGASLGWVPEGRLERIAGRSEAAVLTAYPDVTALFAYSDLIAVGAIRAALRLGRQVPESCAVVGFDGLPLGELITPALTSVHIDTWQLGELAVDQVARHLGETADVVVPHLVIRNSS